MISKAEIPVLNNSLRATLFEVSTPATAVFSNFKNGNANLKEVSKSIDSNDFKLWYQKFHEAKTAVFNADKLVNEKILAINVIKDFRGDEVERAQNALASAVTTAQSNLEIFKAYFSEEYKNKFGAGKAYALNRIMPEPALHPIDVETLSKIKNDINSIQENRHYHNKRCSC